MKTKRTPQDKKQKRIVAQKGSNKKKHSSVSVAKAEPFPSDQSEEQKLAIETSPSPEILSESISLPEASIAERPSTPSSSSAGNRPVASSLEESTPLTEEMEASPAEAEELELLTFFLAKEEYGIDIKMIQEITKITDITPVPRTPSYIHGIVTLRGNVIPVFNIHDRLKLDPFVEGSKSRFVICQLKEGAAAITVDAVTDVVHLKRNRLEPPPSGITANGGGYIKNIGRFKERLLILLDLQKALQIDSSYLK